jgi:hypothetical protein
MAGRGGFPKPAAPRLFAGSQTGKARASGSTSLKQRMADVELDSAKQTFLECLVFMRTSSGPVSRSGFELLSSIAFG